VFNKPPFFFFLLSAALTYSFILLLIKKLIIMWTVILHFNRGSVQTMKFVNKEDALNCVKIIVFNNEDCINCSIFKETKSVEAKEASVDVITSKF